MATSLNRSAFDYGDSFQTLGMNKVCIYLIAKNDFNEKMKQLYIIMVTQ
jgi:hypothetical protein